MTHTLVHLKINYKLNYIIFFSVFRIPLRDGFVFEIFSNYLEGVEEKGNENVDGFDRIDGDDEGR